MANWGQLIFQDSATPIITLLISFHDFSLIIITLVITTVRYTIMLLIRNKLTNRIIKEAHKIELIWTIIPGIILLFLAVPSLRILYLIDEINSPSLTVKIIGHQWYWRYEYGDFTNLEFDSFILNTTDLNINDFRLLEVDNRIIIPIKTEIRLLVTARDVIHSWTIPAIGLKVDAIPGRLNQLSIFLNRPGVFYGQCSEICGANHSFIPITVESINIDNFIKWSNKK